MNIKIARLELTNFKCFKHKELSFDSDVTTIRGRNGAGKTTVADAILWCLFGKNSAGQSDFDLKTHGDDGKPIPNLDHSVEMVLACDNSTITLKRTLKETWIKKRGSEEQVFKNNTTEYLVNGDSYTAADYKKYIAQLVDEDVFKAITNPTYFPSLKWQQQREFLTAMAGDITPEANDTDIIDLIKQLTDNNEDIIAYRKHLSYQIKQIKDKLEKIPVRLEEQNKALPEKLDWDALQEELKSIANSLNEIEVKIIAINSGNGDDIRKAELRVELDNLSKKAFEMQEECRKRLHGIRIERDNKVSEATRNFSSLLNTQRDLETSIQSFERLIVCCQATLDQCEKDAQQIREEWAHNISRTFHFHEADGVCPTCGQYLPDELVAEKRKKAEENFNTDKARIKTELTEKANKVKVTRADAEKQLEDYKSKKLFAETNLAKVKDDINITFADKQKLEKEPLPTFEDEMLKNEEYQNLAKQIASINEQIQYPSKESEEDKKKLDELKLQRNELEQKHISIQMSLGNRQQYDKIQSLIAGINDEQKELVRQLSELERKEDVANRYQDRQNAILEERINEHFSLVKWRMFRTVNNGGDPFDEPYCECYVDGVAYHDGLNQAARLNAGLDICNALCKHYNVSAPIIIDNSESSLNILSTTGQQLRLEVFDSELQIM